MKKRFLSILLLLLCPALTLTVIAASPNAASNYFNEAAFLYTDQKTDEALDLTKQGLESYPDDLPLIKLKELLEKQQEQEQQQQEQEQQQKEQQKKEDQQKKQEQQKDQQQDQQKQNEEDKQEKDQQNKPEQNQEQEQQEQRAEEMTPEEAQLLLDAMRDDEKAQRDAMRMIMGAPEPPQNGKDW